MKHLLKSLLPALLLAAAVQAQPRINSVLNNASYTVPPLPGSAIAPGSIFAVFGANMGPAALVQAGFPLPTTLAGTAVRISASGRTENAFLIYTSAGQLAGVLPSTTPAGPATATVIFNGQESAQFAFTVTASNPGLFTLNGGGTGPAVLTLPDYRVITYSNAATDGDVLSAWGTGIGALTGRPDNQPAEFFDPQTSVEVLVGGKQATVRYRGRAPGLSGVDQLVFDVPAGVRGCNVSLVIKVGRNISNFSTLPVAGSNRVCSDPGGLSENDISRATANGLRIGSIFLNRTRIRISLPGVGSAESRTDIAGADFTRFDANGFIRSQGGVGGVSIGSCVVTTFSGEGAPGDPYAVTKLNAGAQLTLNGPNGITRTLTREADGGYSAAVGTATVIPGFPTGANTLYLDPGTYTVTGPGGADVGSFTARVTVPQPLTTNLDSINSVGIGSPLTVTWNAAGASANELIFIAGSSTTRNPVAGASFVCFERASAGTFTVPAEVTLAMPRSETIEGAATGALTVISSPYTDANRFTASGLDIGTVTYSTAEAKTVSYQ
ncbi:MAG: hypothetical protein IT162_10425 [Bryobacterales bacterium]|nr:hypothetical protein [Bryobacterales bacterium]